jgi:hypothetical protein
VAVRGAALCDRRQELRVSVRSLVIIATAPDPFQIVRLTNADVGHHQLAVLRVTGRSFQVQSITALNTEGT